ncbi:MAG: response regulator [Roseburia sp.]|nr:response regulator [Ruminococcus sp.]MCM1154701.1 response regulator [Roseburia sp.]MCM1242123.1 response regulator [Roseburia sp.]
MKLKTILVDDELYSMEQFASACRDTDIELVGSFENAHEALVFAGKHDIDLAFLDVEIPDMSGLVLGRKLREIKHDMIVIYVSGYEKYLKEAILDVKADYYLLKPYDHKDIVDILDRARYLSGRLQKRMKVHTFGNFDVFVDGQLVEFTNQKAKELFALCIDCGGGAVMMQEAVDLLWEGRAYDDRVKGLYRKAVAYLHTLFKEYGVGYVFDSARGSCHVNRKELSCDYFEILDGKRIDESLFDGRYMMNYSWSEETCGRLCHMASAYLAD